MKESNKRKFQIEGHRQNTQKQDRKSVESYQRQREGTEAKYRKRRDPPNTGQYAGTTETGIA